MSNSDPDIRQQLELIAELHQRAVSDYAKCLQFNRLLAELLDQVEEQKGCEKLSQRLMTILIDCNPREGSHCEKAVLVGERIRKL